MASFLTKLTGWFGNKSQNSNVNTDQLDELSDSVLIAKGRDIDTTRVINNIKATPSRSDQSASVTKIPTVCDSGFEDGHSTIHRVNFAMSDDSASDDIVSDIGDTTSRRVYSSTPNLDPAQCHTNTPNPSINPSIGPAEIYRLFNELNQSRTPKATTRRDKEPMKFAGNTDWKDYLGHFRAVSQWNDWTYSESGLQLAISLTDEAREVLGSLTLSRQHDYDTLVDALTRRFSPLGRESQYSLELMNKTCKPEESVSSYGHSLQRLASRAYPGQPLDEKIMVDLYIKGLPNHDMKRHVYLAKPQTLNEAINSAVAYEAFDSPLNSGIDKLRKPKPNISAMPVQKPTGSHANDNSVNNADYAKFTDTLNKIGNAMDRLNENVDRLSGQRSRGTRSPGQNFPKDNIECYRCHQVGHFARNCPTQNNPGVDSHYRNRQAHNGLSQGPTNRNMPSNHGNNYQYHANRNNSGSYQGPIHRDIPTGPVPSTSSPVVAPSVADQHSVNPHLN